MPFYTKLAIFWVAVYAVVWLLAQFPNSRISQLAFTWHGPVPTVGELKSRYLFRWAIYALGWLMQVGLLCSCGWLAAWWIPSLGDATLFLVFWAFALPLFAGMAALGALIASCAALKARVFGPDPVFVGSENDVRA